MGSVISACAKLDRARIDGRLSGCASLPSLSTIDSALRGLLGADQNHNTSQIAEVISRDPSLTARLLRLVKAVHYGSSRPPSNIDEAVLFLGVRQIRQLAMVTQIIEDFQRMAEGNRFPWQQFWRHCIATALMTREITGMLDSQDGEIDYVAGLIHDVGKIAMASAFPDHFDEIHQRGAEEGGDLMSLERQVLGVDHAELGAMYLRRQRLADVYVEIVQHHHSPQLARYHRIVTAAVQVSDMLVRHAKIGHSGNEEPVPVGAWVESAGGKILFGHQTRVERDQSWSILLQRLEEVPGVLESLV
jgi:putative nucleotidyltransferase with HDIG domain